MPLPSALSKMGSSLRYWLLHDNLVHGGKEMTKCKSQCFKILALT